MTDSYSEPTHKCVVLYKTDSPRPGDEFYQICFDPIGTAKLPSFQIKVFHGVYKSPPQEPESTHTFSTYESADRTWAHIVKEIRAKGFRPYSRYTGPSPE